MNNGIRNNGFAVASRYCVAWLCSLAMIGASQAFGADNPADNNSTISNPLYDPVLAQKAGGNDQGMRAYVLVVLKSGPTPVPKGPERDAMFKGHFANMTRLADAGILAYAGPLDGVDGWRGLFIMAVDSIEDAQKHVATDPVISKGEMIAEYHKHYGSAALMLLNEQHKKLGKTASP